MVKDFTPNDATRLPAKIYNVLSIRGTAGWVFTLPSFYPSEEINGVTYHEMNFTFGICAQGERDPSNILSPQGEVGDYLSVDPAGNLTRFKREDYNTMFPPAPDPAVSDIVSSDDREKIG